MKLFGTLILAVTSLILSQALAAGPAKHGANLNLLPPPEADKSLATNPGKTTLESPAALAKVSGAAVTLKWKEVPTADSYHVQVATDPNFKWLVQNQTFVKGTTFELTGLEAGQQYFWRVAGMKSNNVPEYLKGPFVSSSFEVR